MCISFNRKTIYTYVFSAMGADERERVRFRLPGIVVAGFCNELRDNLNDKKDVNPCLQYVMFLGFDSDVEIITEDDKQLFYYDGTNVFVSHDAELDGKSEEIAERYDASFGADNAVSKALVAAYEETIALYLSDSATKAA